MGRDEFLEILQNPKYALLFLKERLAEMSDQEAVEMARELYFRLEARAMGKRRRVQVVAS